MKIELDGSRVLVLGGTGVLGGLIAAELVSRGARVMVSGRSPTGLAARHREFDGAVERVPFDFRYDEPADLIDTTITALGGLDGVVNAAGVVAFDTLEATSDRTLLEVIDVDLIAPLRLVREAVSRMDTGFLVNITGVVAEQPVAGMTAYVAAKTGLSAATRALGRELRRRGILVIDARPPHTETGLASRAISGEPPRFPGGLEPRVVAERIVAGIMAGEREIPAAAFGAP